MPKSSGRAAFTHGASFFVRAQPRISTPALRYAGSIFLKNAGAIFSCTSSVSIALQTPGRCTLALKQTLTAIGMSAASST